jgi:hypothetical protein
MSCLFCNGKEKNYRPVAGIDFICGSCVQLLLGADQDDLKRAHAKAVKKGYTNKARAIESFIIPEETNEQRKPKSKKYRRHFNGKRVNRVIGNQKERIKRVAL